MGHLHGQIVGIEMHAIATVDVLAWAAALSGQLQAILYSLQMILKGHLH